MSYKKNRVKSSVVVERANEATAAKLAEILPASQSFKDTMFQFQLKRASHLSAKERDKIWHIADTNMRDLSSKSSMGWHEDEKKKELFDPTLSRFIIVRHPNEAGDQESGVDDANAIVAFSMFRFEYDQGERLLYCYEVQIAEPWRRFGLGRFLVNHLLQLGRKWKMEKVMLTVLKANASARDFYLAMGFIKDESSPDYVPPDGNPDEAEDCDYDIRSYAL